MGTLSPKTSHREHTLQLLRLSHRYPGAAQYPQTLDAVDRLVAPPTAPDLWLSIPPLAYIWQLVPWLSAEVLPVLPALEDLTELGRITSTLEIPPPRRKGYARYPIYKALRIADVDRFIDKPYRALLLTIAARALTISDFADRRLTACQRCLTRISSSIAGLYTTPAAHQATDFRTPLVQILENCAHAESLCSYVDALRDAILDSISVPPDLRRRFQLDVPVALGIKLPRPEPPGKPPKKKITPLPPDEPSGDLSTAWIPGPITDVPIEGPQEERLPGSLAVHTEGSSASQATLPELLESARRAARPQRIRHSNDHLLALHADVLTPAEARTLAPALTTVGIEAAKRKETDRALTCALTSLMLALGYEPGRAAMLLSAPPKTKDRPRLSHDGGHVVAPILAPPDAFSPCDTQQSLLVPVSSHIRIPLPPPLTKLLCLLTPDRLDSTRTLSLQSSIREIVGEICAEHDLTEVTAGRIRRTAAATLHEFSRDLAAVMHLTRDTMGHPMTHLYYCAFEESELQRIYRGAIWALWGHSGPIEPGTSKMWIGSAGLVRQKFARQMCRSVSAPLHAGIPDRPNREGASRVHNLMVAHVSAMLLSVVGHRPTDALSHLTLNDFDLVNHGAVLQDKRTDIAHCVRIVGLGQKVSQQIEAYVSHLLQLRDSGVLGRRGSRWIRGALEGTAPLLFALSDSTIPETLTISRIKEQLPGPWREVPYNWGRHYIASIGRTLGVSPEILAIQLGHYESVGYPFGPDSPLSPIEFLGLVNPALDELFRHQGWKIRTGFGRKRRWHDDWASVGPPRSWEADLNQHSALIRRQRAEIRSHYQASLRNVRDSAEEMAIEETRKIDPSLADLLACRLREQRKKRHALQGQKTGDEPVVGETLPERPGTIESRTEDVLNLLEALESKSGANRALHIAAVNAVSRTLRWASNTGIYRGYVPGFWHRAARLEPTPFLVGHMQAVRQVQLLRCVVDRSIEGRALYDDRAMCLGTVALGLIVYGGIDRKETLIAMLSEKTEVYGIPAIPDALVVLCPDGTSIGLRQRAALLYAAWRCHPFSEGDHGLKQIEAAFARILPGVAFTVDKLVENLCETIAVHHRYERSGLANLALDPARGAIPLPRHRLRKLLGLETEEPVADQSGDFQSLAPPPTSQSEVHQQYRQINAIWPNKKHDIKLSRTGEVVEIDRREKPSRKLRIYHELLEMSLDPSWSRLTRTLAGWLAWELVRGNPEGGRFRNYGDVYTWFTEVAKRIVDGYDPAVESMDPEVMETAYLIALERAALTNQRRIGWAILRYHSYLVQQHGVSPIDTTDISALTRLDESGLAVDADLMLPEEIGFVEHLLRDSAYPKRSVLAEQNVDFRLLRQSHALFAGISITGARYGEIADLRNRDLLNVDDRSYILIRPTARRRLKTRNARRIIPLSEKSDQKTATAFLDWVRAERGAGILKALNDPIFSDFDGSEVAGDAALHLRKCYKTLSSNLGLHNHHLRHSALNDLHLRLLLGISLQDLTDAKHDHSHSAPALLPRDLARHIRTYGHGRPRVSIRHYMHLPWAFSLRSQHIAGGSLDARFLAGSLNISVPAGYKRLERGQSAGKSHCRIVGDAIRQLIRPDEVGQRPHAARPQIDLSPHLRQLRLSRCVHLISCGNEPSDVAQSCGVSDLEMDALNEHALQLADQTGIGLLPGIPRATNINSVPPRWYGDSTELQRLWLLAEAGGEDAEIIRQIATDWYAHASRSDRAHIRLPESSVLALRELVRDDFEIETRPDPAGRVLLTVHLRSPSSNNRSLNHVLAWVLAISWLVIRTKDIQQ